MKNKYKVLLILMINIMIFSFSQPGNNVQAETLKKSENLISSQISEKNSITICDIKLITGENIIKDSEKVYKSEIYSNKNEITLQLDFHESVKANDIIATGSDNLITGEVLQEKPFLIKIFLKPSSNTIIIKNKNDNSEIFRLYITFNYVDIEGAERAANVGDSSKLTVKNNDMKYSNVKWSADEEGIVNLNSNGEFTPVNSGIAHMIGKVYGKDNSVIGTLYADVNICGDKRSGWVQENGKWYYIDEKTQMKKIGWIFSNDEWYCTDSNGIMQTGWIQDNGTWYYLKENGTMATSWIKDNGKWYLMDAGGIMKTGWAKDHGNWYYLNNDGSMQTGNIIIDNVQYVFNSHGELQGNKNNIDNDK